MAVIHLGVTQIYQFIDTNTSEAAALNYKGVHLNSALNLLATPLQINSNFHMEREKKTQLGQLRTFFDNSFIV